MPPQQKLDAIIQKNNSLVCVGLDSELKKLPPQFNGKPNAQFEFNKWIIDQTHDLVCAYKPNSAFYEAQGDEGVRQLKLTGDYLRNNCPDIFIILDAKRGDIGLTNEGYITWAYDWLGVDAITLHPYLGSDALKPFLERKDKVSIILCRTSNPGAGELQDLMINGEPLYNVVAKKVVNDWNKNGNCFMVTGATYPEELAEIRKIAGDMTFLVPGIGAQGGDVEKTVKAGLNSKKEGMIINSSRGIIFAQNPREETIKLRDEINKYRI